MGFEPTVPIRHNGFQDRRIRPLCHPSSWAFVASRTQRSIIEALPAASDMARGQDTGAWTRRLAGDRVDRPRPRTGRYGQISRNVHGSRRAANLVAAQLLAEAANSLASAATGSVGHLLDAFLDHARARGLAPKSILGYGLLAKQAKAEFGAVELRKLTAAKLDAYYRGLIERGLSATTVRHHHAFLRSALRQAVRWGWIVRSPADSASPPRAATAEPAAPTVEGVRRMLTVADSYNPALRR